MRLQRIYHVFVTRNSRVGTNSRANGNSAQISRKLYEWLNRTEGAIIKNIPENVQAKENSYWQ